MSELKEIIGRAAALRAAGEPGLLATLMSVRGSSYRRPGARLLISGQGVAAGAVSGGCLERDLARRGWWETAGGGPALVTYDSTDDEEELGNRIGLGCNGAVDILIERLHSGGAAGALTFIAHCFANETDGSLLTVFRSTAPEIAVGAWAGMAADGQAAGTTNAPELLALAKELLGTGCGQPATRTLRGGAVEVLAEPVRAPPHLFVMGSGYDAAPLVALAGTLGWTVTVWDPSARFETRARFAAADHRHTGDAGSLRSIVDGSVRPVAMVMSHDLDRDREALKMLLGSRAHYVGVLGPRRRTQRLLGELGPLNLERLYAPAGLAIGAESAAEIALAVVAEIETVLNDETVEHLRDRSGAIHRAPFERTSGERTSGERPAFDGASIEAPAIRAAASAR
jgi:xanthine dehydrogenase accessory factor